MVFQTRAPAAGQGNLNLRNRLLHGTCLRHNIRLGCGDGGKEQVLCAREITLRAMNLGEHEGTAVLQSIRAVQLRLVDI
jgi:hypothetical protein